MSISAGQVEALRALEKAATRYYDAASEHFSDTDYNLDGLLAEADAELWVIALPAARLALTAAASIPASRGETDRWRCAKCGCRSYARVDKLSDGGKVAFEPGDNVRCVECKDVSYFPASPAPQPVQEQEPVAHEDWRFADALEPFLAVAKHVVNHPAQYQGVLMRSGGLSNARDLFARDFQRLLEASPRASPPEQELTAKVERLEDGLKKISAIRDSIIGFQNVGWSEHIYPLVAALHDAGFDGIGYDKARENVSTLLDLVKAAEAKVERLTEALKPFAKCADMLAFYGATAASEIELSGDDLLNALLAARAALGVSP